MDTQKVTLTYGSNTITIPANGAISLKEIITSAGEALSIDVGGQYVATIHRNGGGIEIGHPNSPVYPGDAVEVARSSGTKGF